MPPSMAQLVAEEARAEDVLTRGNRTYSKIVSCGPSASEFSRPERVRAIKMSI
jgi:hypothetical protein